MTVRSIALALTAAAAVASAPAGAAGAATMSGGWQFKGQYRTLTDCENEGRAFIAKHQAVAYKCENDYTKNDAPALDLYIR
jgi:hypothetical protein